MQVSREVLTIEASRIFECSADKVTRPMLDIARTVYYTKEYLKREAELPCKLESTIPTQKKEELSSREMQVLIMMLRHKSVSEIAKELFLSVKTVSTYKTRVKEKLGAVTNADIFDRAKELNLI